MDTNINNAGYMEENEFYSHDDYAQLGGRMVKKQVISDTTELIDLDKEMSLVSVRQFESNLVTRQLDSGKTVIEIAGDRVEMRVPKGKSAILSLNDRKITGTKKLIVVQAIVRSGYVLDRGESGEWSTMVIGWNGKLWTVGTLKEGTACFISRYNEFFDEVNSEEYYKQLFKERTQHVSKQMPIELWSDAYGDAITGLGSIVEDAVEDQVLDALALIEGYMGESSVRELVESWAVDQQLCERQVEESDDEDTESETAD